MPDFNIHLIDYVVNEGGAHFGDADKNFILNGILNLFQRVASEGKSRADALPRGGAPSGSPPRINPVYNINVSWLTQPPASSPHFICYFLRTQSGSIIRRLIHNAVPEAQGLTTEYNSQSISEVYVIDQSNLRRQLGNEHIVAVVFHEFLHNRLEVPSSIAEQHVVHEEDPTGYGTPGSTQHMTGVQADDPATLGDDERYWIFTRDDHRIVLTPLFDIDVVYASLGIPISQYIFLRPTASAPTGVPSP